MGLNDKRKQIKEKLAQCKKFLQELTDLNLGLTIVPTLAEIEECIKCHKEGDKDASELADDVLENIDTFCLAVEKYYNSIDELKYLLLEIKK